MGTEEQKCTAPLLVKQHFSWIIVFVHSRLNLSNISGFMSKRRGSLTVPIGLGCTSSVGENGIWGPDGTEP